MAIRCDECRKPVRGEGHRTVVRVLCDQCYNTSIGTSIGTAAGLMAGGTAGAGISTSGWFTRIRAHRKKT